MPNYKMCDGTVENSILDAVAAAAGIDKTKVPHKAEEPAGEAAPF